jgi:hypothetical protein
MSSWQKALGIALGIPSTILGVFFGFQALVERQIISQGAAQGFLVTIVVLMLIKMIQVSWKKKK